ncbi:2-hydroxyacyl-CoA dehydratase family protein [Deltaproteobacteria bacterium TL4]
MDDLAEALKSEWKEGIANIQHKSLKTNIIDLGINLKYRAGLARNMGSFVKTQRFPQMIQGFQRYPWLKDFFLNLEILYAKLVHRRTGAYREANAFLITDLLFKLFSELLDGIFNTPERLVLHEDMVPPEILIAMGLKPWMAEFGGIVMPLVFPAIVEEYIDAAESQGITPDTCSLPKATMGMALREHIPAPVAIIASNLPCDGGMSSYTLIEKTLAVPTFRLDIPHHFKSKRAVDYFVGELRQMIAWLEKYTPGSMDWDRLKAICETRNQIKELELEIWEMLRERPAPMAGEPIIYGHLIGTQVYPGHPAGLDYFQKLYQLTDKIHQSGKGALPEERYRALMWNPTTPCFPDVYNWCEQNYGVAFLMDMLSFQQHGFIDTSSEESMLRGLAQITMEGPMARHTRGPCENFFSDLFYTYEHFDLDLIFMAEHVGCKNTKALNGMFREQCRKRKIPLFFLQYDLCDPRIASPADMKKQISEFMETIMKAKRRTA